MAEMSLAAGARRQLRVAAAALLGLGAMASGAALLPAEAQARTARGAQQLAGVWDATWRNSSGEVRRGLIVVDQRGSQVSARIESHGNVVATGTLAGSTFTLRGTRMAIPFTVTGRVQGRKMSGTLTALLVERQFTATRRKGR